MKHSRPNEKVDNVFEALVRRRLNDSHQVKAVKNERRLLESGNADFETCNKKSDARRVVRSSKSVSDNFLVDVLTNRICSGRMVAALRLTCDNLDDMLDDNDDLYEEVYDKLVSLSSEDLVKYITVLLGALR